MIYLASPYTHPDPEIREARFQAVCRAAAHLMSGGLLIFSPIAHTHPIVLAGDLPKGWDYWEKFDREMIEACEELWILMLPGWEDSAGVQMEMRIAEELHRTVMRIYPWPEDLVDLRLKEEPK